MRAAVACVPPGQRAGAWGPPSRRWWGDSRDSGASPPAASQGGCAVDGSLLGGFPRRAPQHFTALMALLLLREVS